jgi:hypothetical protein
MTMERERVPRRPAAVLLAVFVAACAAPAQTYPPGSNVDTVLRGMGPPTQEHLLPSGGRRLEYAGGTYGRFTYMFDFDASGKLVHVEQVRDEAHFNVIKAGMTSAEVLAQIGRPATTWLIAWQRQVVWSYRYETPFCQWFMVGMSPEGRVVDTAYGPDPLCERDNHFPHMHMRRH